MKILFLICSLIVALSAIADNQQYKADQISLAEGLSQSIVYDIAQDDAGYLWFGTQDGLNRFDGIRFDIFKNEPFDTTSISSNQISALLFDSKKRLWIGTHNHGLNLFNKTNRTFTVVYGDIEEKENVLNKNSIRCIYEDKDGIIWIGTPRGIASIDNKNFITEYSVKLNDQDTLPVFVNAIINYKDDILIATGKGIFRLNRNTNKINFISHLPFEKIERQWIFSLAIDNASGSYFAGTHNGLFRFSFAGDNINIEALHRGNAVPSLLLKNNRLIASLEGKGLFNILAQEDKPELVPLNVLFPLPSMRENDLTEVIAIHFDEINEGMLWAGTSTRGVIKLSPILKNFHTDRFKNAGVPNSFVTAIIKDNRNNKWIGTPDGLLKKNYEGQYFHFDNELRINNLKRNYIGALKQDKKGRLWIGKVNGIMYTDNPDQTKPEFKIAMTSRGREYDVIRYFYEGKNGEFYAVSKYSVLKYNRNQNEFEIVISDPDTIASQQPGYALNSMLIDTKNNMWIATTAGLILKKHDNDDFQFFYHKRNDPGGLRDHTIQHIYEDTKGNIWLATSNGFSKITTDGVTVNIINYSSHDGLGNNFVYAILEDRIENKLWISTNGGLTCFDPETNLFSTFTIHDGLQSNEFNSGAFSQAYDGEMYFGGIDGYTHFYPSEIKIDSTPPRVFIAAFNIPGKEKRFIYFDDNSIDKKINLKYFENSFSVNFAGLHYINPLKNTYSYKLEGYQDDWIFNGHSNSINFSQLPPGDYTLRVKAANSDGIFNEIGDILTISISPPFWHTAWFYASAFILIGLLLYGLHRYRLSLKMQQVLAIDKIRKETAEDFHDELGHKLTTISWFGEIVKSKLKTENKDVKIYLDKIVETSQQMYHTMKDLLWAMDPDKDTVNDLYTQIKEFGEDLFDKTGIEFNSVSNVDLKGNKILPLHHKRQVILIFKEVMHNTLKHSRANKANFNLVKSNGQIHFHFSDNGKGYTLNGHPTGFGLKNVRRRSELLNADLKIASTGEGTSVDLSFISN